MGIEWISWVYNVHVEDKRSSGSGFFRVATASLLSSPPLFRTAALSLAVMVFALATGTTRHLQASNPTPPAAFAEISGMGASSAAPVSSSDAPPAVQDPSSLAPAVVDAIAQDYTILKQQGLYSTTTGQAVAAQIAASIRAPVSYKPYSAADLSVTADISHARVARYQTDLKRALSPLAGNTTPEISLFSDYMQSKDPKYLAQLRSVASDYDAAILAAANVQVPQNAVQVHVGILNAMQEFSATLAALAGTADDPVAAMAMLGTYNSAEHSMVVSFNAFAGFIQSQHLAS